MQSLAVGLASGLGNCVYMLPAIKALHLLGHRIDLYVQTDFPTADLWRRCIHVDEILEPPANTNGYPRMCGQWLPAAWRELSSVARFKIRYPYLQAEWQSNMRLATMMGWNGDAPDVSDWCRDLDRSPRWDVGIVPGSKDGAWMRKRWPGMINVAVQFVSRGLKVAVFGLEQDGVDSIPGEHINTERIAALPDALAGCRIVIGTDSGVAHLASSLGIPTVIVYTATSEIKGDPVGKQHNKIAAAIPCRPCQSTAKWNVCRDWRCREINPARVIRAADELLETE